MTQYEYRVLPAPTKGQKVKGAKTPDQRFAASIEASLNAEAGNGWEFLRAETLPSIERQGLTGSRTVFQTLLVFRRPATAAEGKDEGSLHAPLRLLEDQTPEDPTEEPPAAEPENPTEMPPVNSDAGEQDPAAPRVAASEK